MNKLIIYQVLPRLFGNGNLSRIKNGNIQQNGCGKMNDFTQKALSEIKKLGATHIWYTGIIEHATQTDYTAFGIKPDNKSIVKGIAGSPYAVKDYYDIDPDLAVKIPNRMKEFENLINRTHKNGLKVIIDFIPNHVARQYHSDSKPQSTVDLGETDNPAWTFSPLNNFYYIPESPFQPAFDIQDYTEYPAKATGNDLFTASPGINDWYETVKLNYGVNYVEGGQKQFNPVPDTWHKMFDILYFWASKKIDGFRCDMAEMVPVEFWAWAIPKIKLHFPEIIFIAEVYNPNEYRNYIFNGNFDYLYDKVGLYDKLRAILTQNNAASEITQCWQSLTDIGNYMLNFLENHDEQRIASEFFCGNAEQAFPAMVVSATLGKSPVMIYSGQELGEGGNDAEGFSGFDGRTSIFDYWCVQSINSWRNNGNFNEEKLSQSQIKIRNFYKTLLQIVNTEKAISEGDFFDLEYANFQNPGFNPHYQYAFVRKYTSELILIIVNFDSVDVNLRINLPIHLFNYFSVSDNVAVTVTDLFTGTDYNSVSILSSEKPVEINVDKHGFRLLKMKL